MYIAISYKEMDTLGAALSKYYLETYCSPEQISIDIDKLVTEVLETKIIYENLYDYDHEKIGFASNGIAPLTVIRDNKAQEIIFPRGTIIIDKSLLNPKQENRRRFTVAHEISHKLINYYCSKYDDNTDFSKPIGDKFECSYEDLKKMLFMLERYANRLAAALLMPDYLVRRLVEKYNNGKKIIYYTKIFAFREKQILNKIAEDFNVSYAAVVTRLQELELLDYHPMEEFMDKYINSQIFK